MFTTFISLYAHGKLCPHVASVMLFQISPHVFCFLCMHRKRPLMILLLAMTKKVTMKELKMGMKKGKK